MKGIDIALVGGYASTNIGNEFFTRSIANVLSRISRDLRITVTQNLPGYYWKEKRRNPANSFNYIRRLNVDYLILTGPLFDKDFPLLWEETLSELKRKGTKILFFSAGSQQYDEEEKEMVRKFLEQVEPYAIVSRDTPTYEAYGDLALNSYKGIDFAFFLNDFFDPVPLDTAPYVVLNFDTGPEPRFGEGSMYEHPLSFLGREWSYSYTEPGRIMKILGSRFPGLYWFHNDTFGELAIVRPVNYTHQKSSKRLFRSPRTYVSELASDYLNLFSHAEGVLSSRVHSCIASLVLGKEVMLFSKTRRGKLFDRVGLHMIREQPVTLDPLYIKKEKEQMVSFVENLFT